MHMVLVFTDYTILAVPRLFVIKPAKGIYRRTLVCFCHAIHTGIHRFEQQRKTIKFANLHLSGDSLAKRFGNILQYPRKQPHAHCSGSCCRHMECYCSFHRLYNFGSSSTVCNQTSKTYLLENTV